jgi:lactate dehydrogenase-like 2-hydroxyacid dehydrogenase
LAKPTVLMMTPMLPPIVAKLEERFEILWLPGAPDPKAVIDQAAETVRGIGMFPTGVVDAEMFSRLRKLEIIAVAGAGYEGVDVPAARAHNVLVTNAPDALTQDVADVAMALIVMTVRRLAAADAYLRAGKWEAKGPMPISPGSLAGGTLGILGFGRIGRAVARRAEAFGLKIAYHGRTRQEGVGHAYFDSAHALAEASDILLVATPGGAETRHMVNADVLAKLGSRGYLVNIGRGTAVDEAALVAALEAGTIAGAGLDVYEDEPRVHPGLIAREDVVLLPHLASGSVPTRTAMGQAMLDNLDAWFTTGRGRSPVAEMASD